jgi:hypothetical protein
MIGVKYDTETADLWISLRKGERKWKDMIKKRIIGKDFCW